MYQRVEEQFKRAFGLEQGKNHLFCKYVAGAERIELLQLFINQFGKHCIRALLADREFIGGDWFAWLLCEKIPFNIRIRNNTVTTNSRGMGVDIDALFYGLKPGEQRILKGQRIIWGQLVCLSGLRLTDGE